MKTKWKKKIDQACFETGSDGPEYELTRTLLIEILNRRDEAAKAYTDSGSQPVVEFINGNTGINQNLKVWMELNQQVLACCRELGLTPAARSKLAETTKTPEANSLLSLIKGA